MSHIIVEHTFGGKPQSSCALLIATMAAVVACVLLVLAGLLAAIGRGGLAVQLPPTLGDRARGLLAALPG